MFLHSMLMSFQHPYTNESVRIIAPLDEVFERTLRLLNLHEFLPNLPAVAFPPAEPWSAGAKEGGIGSIVHFYLPES